MLPPKMGLGVLASSVGSTHGSLGAAFFLAAGGAAAGGAASARTTTRHLPRGAGRGAACARRQLPLLLAVQLAVRCAELCSMVGVVLRGGGLLEECCMKCCGRFCDHTL